MLTKFELHEIFNIQDKKEAEIEFGISKRMDAMIMPEVTENQMVKSDSEVYNYGQACPPYCDDRSIYNS